MKPCGKRYVLFSLLFLLLLSPLSFAEVCLTDTEFEELETIFSRLYGTLDQQETAIETLTTQLATADSLLAKSQTSIETLKLTLNEVEKSYAQQKKEAV
jgi:uncharacterized coiled-coil protein SlyX